MTTNVPTESKLQWKPQSILEKGLGIIILLYAISLKDVWNIFYLLDEEYIERWSLDVLWWLLILASLGMISGFYRRLSTLFGLFVHWIFVHMNGPMVYGVDAFISLGFFYLVAAPFSKKGGWQLVLRIHLWIIYFIGGLLKSLGHGWWNGSNLWKVLMQWPFNNVPVEILLHFKSFLPLMGITVVILELCYPLFICSRKTRRIWLAGIIGLHLVGIGIIMEMWLFAFIMILLNIVAYGSLTKHEQLK